MKKIALVLLVVLMATPVFAAKPLRSGLYIGAKTGAMRVNMKREGEKEDDIVFPFALSLGMRIRHFRLEAEYSFGTKAKFENGYEQETEVVSGQLYYDIPFKSAIRPFVNFGIGRHSTRIKEIKTLTRNGFKETRKGWKWDVGAGVTWNISNAVNIDLGYRYLNIGNLKTQNGTMKTQHHFVYIGWRYVF